MCVPAETKSFSKLLNEKITLFILASLGYTALCDKFYLWAIMSFLKRKNNEQGCFTKSTSVLFPLIKISCQAV